VTNYKAYSAYKNSGADWLGVVPEDWEVYPGKRIFGQRRESALANDEQLTASQKYGVIPQHLYMKREGQKVALALTGSDNFKHVEKNDFVISLRSFQGGIERSLYPGCITPAYTVLQSVRKEFIPSYYEFLLKAAPYVHALQASTDSLRDGKAISYDAFGRIPLPIPPLSIQQAIAAFLDRETARIDALIEKKQRQIELLKEKRQAIITQAVTKGLDPNVPMKDSGIEWLGEVPEHWRSTRLKHVTTFITSGSRGWGDFISDSGDIFLQSGDLNDQMGVNFSSAPRVMLPKKAEGKRTKVKEQDVIVCITGAKTGRVGYVAEIRETAYVNQHLALIRPDRQYVFENWLAVVLSSAVGQTRFQLDQYGLKEGLSLDNVLNTPVTIPPLPEQVEILKLIVSETNRIDSLVEKVEASIVLLKERRSALITAAVTGQIDVRGE